MALVPFDDRDGFIWFNGQMVPWREAKVHVLTHGLHYASCVFEGERVYNGKVFKLTEHSRRLTESASILGFSLPYSVAEIDAATRRVLDANGIVDGYVRPLAWRGSEMMGVAAQKNRINVAIAAWQWPSYFSPEARLAGIRLKISPWRRPAPDTAPTHSKAAGLYMICTLSKHQAENDGFDDALMLDYRGRIAEATGANVFLVIDGKLHTPIPDCFLNGITRQTVIDLARRRGYDVSERAIMPEELADAQEVFLTGTAAEVTPVRQIGEYTYTPGEITHRLVEDYDKEVGRTHDKAASASASAA
ncbi:branched-chain amino acid aminotransferase [Rhodospirillum rubrum]|uniref:Branched-chain-amino-acid aminotransferase n=1 Tax=Rhodospirillum rubrum (strain ATCC 11170 / ATH 1.1.1 / DSM 467 / LMG 4362 / NCIMB 8255 / S1) TaxID=269796 RepID=Q2RS72_RHORT|nr:branched-chain amino acid aminotransferase [Rhodospirillum rubrum]ABC23023.1 branched chain amino acid: 2-keto-4-methylthiobutyrate aminotransferase / branched chain amino acid aminotransferase [Rhodospirillum rubrum ATCC 11170]AEO48752.1 branched-chain amino acid aminotransferase [Rhodospirillum rubrum F11]MBK5954651.1 branched-chain amino acid aminotransferase [Rhodospirillum rubrum]QXG79007.1 branched-chain amino acid aminotransferase [Rhodospirillum rubrum]HAQ01362.1 branched-chain amin